MEASIIVTLVTSIPLINGPLRSIELRPPGRHVAEAMAAARAGDRLDAVESALETLFKVGERRLRVSNAIRAQAKSEALDGDD
jgi:hypothetical protein